MTVSGDDIAVGKPYLKGITVHCEVIGDAKGKKKIAYKFRHRESYHRKVGHRDLLTRVKIKEIK